MAVLYSLKHSDRSKRSKVEWFRTKIDRAKRRAEISRLMRQRPYDQITIDGSRTWIIKNTKEGLIDFAQQLTSEKEF